jgi:hypothetical protein
MKKLIITAALLVFLTSTFFTCNESLDVTEEFYLEHTFDIQSVSGTINEAYLLDAAALSSVIAEYGDNIKTIEILETKYVVTYFNGSADQAINIANLYVSDEDGADVQELGTVTNQNLASLVNNEQQLNMQQAGVDHLAALIKNPPHKAQLILTGNASSYPLDFGVKFKFKVKMVANPL